MSFTFADIALAPKAAGPPPTVTSEVACWWADDVALADGAAVSSWSDRVGSKALVQASGTLQPLYRTTGVGGRPGVDFDGTDDYLRYAAANAVSTATAGCFVAVVSIDSLGAGLGAILATADEASLVRFLAFSVESTGKIWYQQRNNDTADQLVGDDVLSTGLAVIEVSTSGTTVALRRNNDPQTITINLGANNGDWFGDSTARDSLTMGAIQRTSVINYFNGKIGMVKVADAELSAADRANLYGWIATYYGVVMA